MQGRFRFSRNLNEKRKLVQSERSAGSVQVDVEVRLGMLLMQLLQSFL